MKVVIAMDSFKGSISSMDAAACVKQGILAVYKDAQVACFPMADGGEGFLDSFVYGAKASTRQVRVSGGLGEPVNAKYGILPDQKCAVIEIAQVVGLDMIAIDKRNPLCTTTYGIGEVILDAMGQGCTEFLIGLGGSSTNDGGVGMLQALGCEFLDKSGRPVGRGGQVLQEIATIQTDKMHPGLGQCKFKIACDVDNPLYGEQGAAAVYAPQKGATPKMVSTLDKGLQNLAKRVTQALGKREEMTAGVGAAGGLAYAFLSFLPATLQKGASIVIACLGLEEKIKEADIVITGEGKMDGQTAQGKAPITVAALAKQHNKKVIAFAGMVGSGIERCHKNGIDSIFCIQRGAIDLPTAMQPATAGGNLCATAQQVFALIHAMQSSAI